MTALSFGTQSTSQAPLFGRSGFGVTTSTTSTSSFASSFPNLNTNVSGSNMAFGSTTSTAPSMFGTTPAFGATFPTSVTTTSSLFAPLGQITSTAPSTGLSFGGFGTGTQSAATGFNFGTTPTITTTAATIGLGGVDMQATSSMNGDTTTGRKDKAVKETLIPNEIAVPLESFKKYIKEQKAVREEMSRVSSKNILRVQSQVSALQQQLSLVSNSLQRNSTTIAKLRQETSEELRNAGIAQRTKDTPTALQYENTAPSAYFHNLAINFENQMQSYRQQIDQLERHFASLSQPSTMTPEELTVVIKRLHDAFVMLAAQLQTVHQKVQYHREQFLSIRGISDPDTVNIFEPQKDSIKQVTTTTYFPYSTATTTPSIVSQLTAALAIVNNQNRAQQLQGSNLAATAGLSSTGLGTGTGFLSNIQQPSFNTSFNLQNTTPFKPLGK